MKKSYDLKAIMSRAWAIRKAAAAEIGCRVSEVIMSECLKMAWAEAEGANAEANAAAVVKEWAGTAPTAQVEWLQRCVVRAAKDVIGYSTEDHYHQFNEHAAFELHGHDFDEYVNEAYIKLYAAFDRLAITNERRAEKGLRPRSLRSLVYNAAKAAIMAIWEADKKHGRAIQDPEIINDNGEAASWIATRAAAAGYDTETSAIIRVDMDKFVAQQDDINKKIIELVQQHYTEREISQALDNKISNVAVHKRIVKMRSALTASGIA